MIGLIEIYEQLQEIYESLEEDHFLDVPAATIGTAIEEIEASDPYKTLSKEIDEAEQIDRRYDDGGRVNG